MGEDDSFTAYVLDQLRDLPLLTSRRMFGGTGLYRGGTFFGILYRGRLYLKTDEAAREAYVARGMGPFQPNPRQTLKSYYEVPPDVLDDPRELLSWADRASRTP